MVVFNPFVPSYKTNPHLQYARLRAAEPVHRSIAMVDALRKIAGRVTFTVYPGVGHNSWTRTYANEALYTWFLQQRRGRPAQPRATAPG